MVLLNFRCHVCPKIFKHMQEFWISETLSFRWNDQQQGEQISHENYLQLGFCVGFFFSFLTFFQRNIHLVKLRFTTVLQYVFTKSPWGSKSIIKNSRNINLHLPTGWLMANPTAKHRFWMLGFPLEFQSSLCKESTAVVVQCH